MAFPIPIMWKWSLSLCLSLSLHLCVSLSLSHTLTGTVWTQQIVALICESDFRDSALYPNNLERMPWLEYLEGRPDYSLRPSPRLFASHLTPALMPPGLRDKKAKVSPRKQCRVARTYVLMWSCHHHQKVYSSEECCVCFFHIVSTYGKSFPHNNLSYLH